MAEGRDDLVYSFSDTSSAYAILGCDRGGRGVIRSYNGPDGSGERYDGGMSHCSCSAISLLTARLQTMLTE